MVKLLLVSLTTAAVTACSPEYKLQVPPVSTTTERQCGTVSSVGADGAVLADGWVVVGQVHHSACIGDYDGLAAHMSEFFGGTSVDEVVTQWRRTASRTHYLRKLAETLEVAPHVTQGGLIFCSPAGPVAVFARGTHDMPASLSDFVLTPGDADIPVPECDR